MSKTFADYTRYEAIRNEKGLTDYAVSAGSGVATATLSSWKQGIYSPKIEKIMAIARFFNVPLESLLTEVPDEKISG